MGRSRRRAGLVAAAGLACAGCGGHVRTHAAAAPATAPATTAAPTTTVAATTTTTGPATPVAPLTGLPEPTALQAGEPAVVVKIDNVVGALPQTGVDAADVVYEEMVEGGLTRLAAIFQSQYPVKVGPVRSARLTDIAIIDQLHHPVFAYAGTNGVFLPIIRSQPIHDVDIDNAGGLFFQAGPNAAPHDTYTDIASDAGTEPPSAPPALFTYRAAGTPMTDPGVAGATSIGLTWPAATVSWTWEPGSGVWSRTQDGAADVDSSGAALTTTNVVVEAVPYIDSLNVIEPSSGPTEVPEGEQVGSGPCWVFSDGQVVTGTWSRSSVDTVATLTDSAGHPIALAPGRTWVELLQAGTAPSY